MHYFEISSSWKGGLAGVGNFKARGLEASFSIPQELKGPGTGTNPEELLLSASASCLLITLGVILSFQDLAVERIDLKSSLELDVNGGFTVKAITHQPVIRLKAVKTDETVAKVIRAVERAEASCLVARAMKGNVKLIVTPPALEFVS